MYSASDLRKGLKIELEGVPYEVTEYQFVKPGKGQAMYKCRIKNLLTQTTQDKTFREVDKIDTPNLEVRELHYSYNDGHHFIFADTKTFEEFPISAEVLGDRQYFLYEDVVVNILYHNGVPIDVQLPYFVEKEIVETEPGVRGDTATNVTKPAKIDTRTGQYVERVARK